MPRLVLICLLCFLSIGAALAQTKRIDSLRAVLAKYSQADTFRVNRLNELANTSPISLRQLDSLATQSLSLAKRLKYPYGQAWALYHLARAKIDAQPKLGQQLLAQALQIAEPIGDKTLLIALTRMAGISYSLDATERKQALHFFKRAVYIAKTIGQSDLIMDSLTDLGYYYYSQALYELALQAYFEALRLARKVPSTTREVSALGGIGKVYFDLTDYNQALRYLLNARQLIKARVNETEYDTELYLLSDIGSCYKLTGRYTQAIIIFQQGLKAAKFYEQFSNYYALTFKSSLADTYERQGNRLVLPYAYQVLSAIRPLRDGWAVNLGSRVSVTLAHYYFRSQRADSALYYSQQGYQLAQQSSDKRILRDASEILAQAYAQQDEYAKAYAYQRKYMAYKDSINNEDVTRKATAAQFNDQLNQQQNQISLLKKDQQLQAETSRRQRLLLLSSLAVLTLIIGLAVVLYRNNRSKQKANALLQTQRDQLNQALTKLKATQTQLIQKEKMASLGELTAGIAHEIQNPLNFVNNFSDVSTELVDELKDGPFQKLPDSEKEYAVEILGDLSQNLQKITLHGGRASAIVRGMLEHSRSSTGEREPTDLNALVDEYLRLTYQGQRTKDKTFNCELVTDFDGHLGKVEMVAAEMGRVLLNLINNAFYAVKEKQKTAPLDYKPQVTIITCQINGHIEIRVRDNGTGIPHSVKAKIFQPFFTTKPTGEGTGLGLSLSHDIVTKGHNGSLIVQSQEGEGTEFIIQLPIVTDRSLA